MYFIFSFIMMCCIVAPLFFSKISFTLVESCIVALLVEIIFLVGIGLNILKKISSQAEFIGIRIIRGKVGDIKQNNQEKKEE